MNIFCKGKVSVPVPGTSVPLTTDPTLTAARLLFQVLPGATGQAFVGVPGLNAGTFSGVARILAPNTGSGPFEAFSIEAQDGTDSIRLSDYAVDAAVPGEGLLVTYWQE